MFESLAESLLKSILGEYVDNLDSQNLSISVWSGHVSLRDLRLKNNLFSKLGLPFDLKLGIIKSLTLEVPWARLASQPVVCTVDQVFLLFSPQSPGEWKMTDVTGFEFKEAKIQEYLQRHLAKAALDLAQRLAQETQQDAKAASKSG